MKKLLIVLLILGACTLEQQKTPLTNDLGHYPDFFKVNSSYNPIIVIDDAASEKDRQSARLLTDSFDAGQLKYYPDYHKFTENAIYLGSCSQEPMNRFANIYADCLSMKHDQAIIRIIDNDGAWILYVIGYDDDMTRNAVDVLINHEDYDLQGEDIEVIPGEDGYRIGEPT